MLCLWHLSLVREVPLRCEQDRFLFEAGRQAVLIDNSDVLTLHRLCEFWPVFNIFDVLRKWRQEVQVSHLPCKLVSCVTVFTTTFAYTSAGPLSLKQNGVCTSVITSGCTDCPLRTLLPTCVEDTTRGTLIVRFTGAALGLGPSLDNSPRARKFQVCNPCTCWTWCRSWSATSEAAILRGQGPRRMTCVARPCSGDT